MGSVESIAKHLIKLNNHKTNISFPAVVVNADRLEDGFVDVKPVVNYMNSVTGDTIEYPVLRDIRVVFPSSKSTTISFPLVQGDTVDLLFQSVDIEDFVNGNSSPHDPFSTGFGNLKNCVALVGFSPYQDSPFNPNNYKNEFNSQDLNIVHNKGTGLESSLNINTSGSIVQKAPSAITVDSPIFDVKSNVMNANNAVISTGGDVVVKGQSLNSFMANLPENIKELKQGNSGWTPAIKTKTRGLDEVVLEVYDWVGGEGEKPSLLGYIGFGGIVEDISQATNVRGTRGKSGVEVNQAEIDKAVDDILSVNKVMNLIQGQIDESSFSQYMKERIDDIEINKRNISQETQNRIQSIINTNNRITDEAEDRIEELRQQSSRQDSLQEMADNLAEDVNTVTLSQIETDKGVASIKQRQETFEIEQGVQAESLNYLSSELDFGFTDKTKFTSKNRGTAWTFAKTVAHEDYTNAQMIRGLSADYQDSSARFTENIELLANKNESLATRTSNLSAQLVGGYDGNDLTKLNSGLLFEESKARANDVEGLAEQISLLSAGVGEQFDSFDIWHFNKDKDGWTGGTFSSGWIDVKTGTLQSPEIIDLDGAVYKHVKLRIKKIGQPTWSGILTHVGGSKVIEEPSYDENGVAIANWHLDWDGDITSFTLKLASVADDTNYYSVDWIAVGRPSPAASHAALLRESKVRAAETSANASDLLALNSQINGGNGVPIESSITKKLDTTANLASTTAEEVSTLKSTYDKDMYGYEGTVQTTARTLASETQAVAESLDLLSSEVKHEYTDKTKYTDKTRSMQWTFAKSVAADNYAANERITNLQSEVADSNANFTNELFTLAEQDKSIAADITQLYAETGANYGLIQDINIAISTPNTGLAAKVTELQSSAQSNAGAASAAQQAADAANQKLEPENLASLVEGSGAFSDEFGSISGQFANFEAVVEGQKTAMEVISGIGNAEKLKNEIAKARLDKDVTNLNAQSVALTTQIDGYTTKIADVTAKRDATSDTDLRAEYDKLITDLTAAKDDLTAQKAVIADQVAQLAAEKKVLDDFKVIEDNVKAQHTIKIDTDDGSVLGYGLVLDNQNISNFNIRANNINFLPPKGGDDGVSQLVVRNTATTIDGVYVPAGLYTRNFYAPRASIDTIQIKDAAIKSAQIDDLAVTTAKIGNAQVDTLQIRGNAVTVPRLDYNPNKRYLLQKNTSDVNKPLPEGVTAYMGYLGNNYGEYVELEVSSSSFDPMGGSVSIQAYVRDLYCWIFYRGNYDKPYPQRVWFGIKITRSDLQEPLRNEYVQIRDDNGKGPNELKSSIGEISTVPILDAPPLGTGVVTYKVAVYIFNARVDPNSNYGEYLSTVDRGMTITMGTTSAQIMGTKR